MRKRKTDKRVMELSDKLAELALDIEYKRTDLMLSQILHARFSAALHLLKNGIEPLKEIQRPDVFELLEKENFYGENYKRKE
jgi:uncharacterized membrane protein